MTLLSLGVCGAGSEKSPVLRCAVKCTVVHGYCSTESLNAGDSEYVWGFSDW